MNNVLRGVVAAVEEEGERLRAEFCRAEGPRGRRGSAISVALLKKAVPVLGVVSSPLAPDRGRDTIAWAEGVQGILRNGSLIRVDLSKSRLAPGELVWTTASAALRPETYARAAEPARFVAMPSIAYR